MIRLVRCVAVVVCLGWCANSANAAIIYQAFLDGSSEDTPNASPGTGYVTVAFDLNADTMTIDLEFSDLIFTTTAAHIHAPTPMPFTMTAGVASETPSFSGFPLGVTDGVYDHVFDLTAAASFNPAYVTANGGTAAGATSTLLAAMADGKAYLNIHTTSFPAGEIRGFFTPIPEPATLQLAGAAVLGLLWFGRRKIR